MNIVSIICCRAGSKGVPNKNIKNFCGKPLLQWTIDHIKNSKLKEFPIYLSTDDGIAADLASKNNIEIIWRPPQLATSTSPSDDALKHAIKSIGGNIDFIFHPQVTSPLRLDDDINEAFKRFDIKKDSMFSASFTEDVCLWEIKFNNWSGKLKYKSVTFDYKNRGIRQERKPFILENGSFYFFKPENLFKYGNRLGKKISHYIMEPWQSFEIDTPDDWDLCEFLMKKKILKEGVINEV